MAAPLKRKIATLNTTPTLPKPKRSKISKKQLFTISEDMSGSRSSLPDPHSPPMSDPDGVVTVSLLQQLLSQQSKSLIEEISKTIHTKVSELTETIAKQDATIQSLEKSNQAIVHENEFLWREVLKPNLVFSGLLDKLNETREETFQIASTILKNTSGQVAPFDTAYRVGNFSDGKCRPIKIRFTSMAVRDEIWRNRFSFKKPIFVNEDLPRMTRRDHAILRGQKKEMISKGVDPSQIKINWNRKTIQHGPNRLRVTNGLIEHSKFNPNQNQPIGGQSSQSNFLEMGQEST